MAQSNAPESLYRNRIHVVGDDELRDWARKLAVTPEKLKAAVAKVGDWADDLQHELADQRDLPLRRFG